MAKKKKSDVAERLSEYRMFYPDTTVTTCSTISDGPFRDKEAFELSRLVCSMTHAGLLQYMIRGRKLHIFKSKEFLKVAEGFKKGAKVRWYDPREPENDICTESTMLADGMRYQDGIPFIWTENSDSGCFAECNTFAVYWRPVEEGK